jgi:acyl transferase domain-containing protein
MTEAISTRDPIAVVGIGCRLPGASGPGELWDLLVHGRDAITEIPARLAAGEKLGAGVGGFVGEIDGFDTEFFGMSAHEAVRLDPQHRLLLETA